MSQRRIDELQYWLHSDNPRAVAWRQGQRREKLGEMSDELVRLRTAENGRQEQAGLQATLKKFDEAMASGRVAQRRQEQEEARQAHQAAVEERRRQQAEQRQASLKRQAEASWRQAGGDPADFERAWEEELKDQALQEETARVQRHQERLTYRPSL